jgi:hypothetical protein
MYRDFSDSFVPARGIDSIAVSPAIVFLATCPQCQREQLQRGFTAADLMGLLYSGYPVQAYCVFCEASWPVGLQKRVELGEMVAAVCGLRDHSHQQSIDTQNFR